VSRTSPTAGYADLHLHTVASDGTQTVSELVARAKAAAFSCIAITDHDAVSRDLTERSTRIDGVEVITGVELKTDFDGVTGELLAYFVNPGHVELVELLAWMDRARTNRMVRMVEKCREIGVDLDMGDVRSHAKGNVGRPHLARALMEKGAISEFDEAFARFIGRGKPCYVPLEKVSLSEAVRVLHAAGGAVSLAHPCLMRVADWDPFFVLLADAGVDAIESVYPYRDPHSPDLSISPDALAAQAAKHGFLVSGGSDDHGPDSTKASLGQIRIPYEHVAALKRLVGLEDS
jgi:predicted metal-dependent phosphoesterase TrpH